MGPVLTGLGDLDRRLGGEEGELHPLLGRASTHVALLEGGTEPSTYAERCVAKVERRTLPGETVALVEEQMRGIAGEATVTTIFSRGPLETPRNARSLTCCSETPARCSARLRRSSACRWTDAALFADAGIPTVVFGPGGAGAHEQTKWVDLDDLERTREILLAAATEFCRP